MNTYEQFPIGARVIFAPQNSRERSVAKRGWSGTVMRYAFSSIIVRWDELPHYDLLAYSPSDLFLVNPTHQSPEDFL